MAYQIVLYWLCIFDIFRQSRAHWVARFAAVRLTSDGTINIYIYIYLKLSYVLSSWVTLDLNRLTDDCCYQEYSYYVHCQWFYSTLGTREAYYRHGQIAYEGQSIGPYKNGVTRHLFRFCPPSLSSPWPWSLDFQSNFSLPFPRMGQRQSVILVYILTHVNCQS